MQNIDEFQKSCAKAVIEIDAKYNIKRDLQFSFTQLMEEIGELAKEINMPRLRNKGIDFDNLEGEFADVIIQLSILAEMTSVNLSRAVETKLKVLAQKHDLKNNY
jgi:NTP pyrophosphatase (non-canonical NTP hydrolase)